MSEEASTIEVVFRQTGLNFLRSIIGDENCLQGVHIHIDHPVDSIQATFSILLYNEKDDELDKCIRGMNTDILTRAVRQHVLALHGSEHKRLKGCLINIRLYRGLKPATS